MDDQYECNQTFHIKILKNKITTRKSFSSFDHQLDINFKFYCKPKYSRWAPQQQQQQDSTERVLVDQFSPPVIEKVVRVSSSRQHALRCDETREAMDRQLRQVLPLTVCGRRKLIDYAWKKVSEIISRSKPAYTGTVNVLDLYFSVLMEHDHVGVRVDQTTIQRSIEESGDQNFMVPAAESTVRSLLEKVMDIDCGDCDETCSVCLEDLLSSTSDDCCEVLCMPCSHIFHGGCITRWLRTSHYCPICRFEMPTSS